MFASAGIFIVLASLCLGQTKADRSCTPDTVNFNTKLEKSTIVVYGKTMAKIMNEGSESIFSVSFQVDCILKGPATVRQINITNAGRAPDREYCQEFPVGRGYSIAFLEPASPLSPDNKNFVPTDFVEIVNDGKNVDELLARTCSLTSVVPLQSIASVSEICPPIATDPTCQNTTGSTLFSSTETLKETTDDSMQIEQTTSDGHGHLSKPIQTPQQEIDAIRAKSANAQTYADTKNAGQSLTWNIFLLSLVVLLFLH